VVRSGILKRLRSLDLRHGCITDQGARILASCPDLRRLEHLDVRRNQLTRAGIQFLESVGINVHAWDQLPGRDIGGVGEYLFEGESE
jgi:hypothetical protein